MGGGVHDDLMLQARLARIRVRVRLGLGLGLGLGLCAPTVAPPPFCQASLALPRRRLR